MKLGVILPTFRDTLDDALAVADRCAALGIDGVFAYDHLWPMGSPLRPSFAPLPVLAQVARRSASLVLGPLVARVGLTSSEHLVAQLRTLERVAPGRVVAALGTGDAKSRDELDAYGLDYAPANVRRGFVREAALALRDEMPVWIGAGAPETDELALRLGVERNLWNVDSDQVRQAAIRGPVNWAGIARDELSEQVSRLRIAGATWAIFAPGVDVEALSLCRPPSATKFS